MMSLLCNVSFMRAHVVRIAVVIGVTSLGCGGAQPRSKIEDQSRRIAPLPACVLHLPERRAGSAGTARKLREDEIVKLMFPSFDESKRTLPQGARSCTGSAVFDDPLFRDGQLVRSKAWPFIEQEGDMIYGGGGDRLKIVWLRTHTYADGSAAGPLAVIRSGERFAELFAVGTYKSQPERTRLATVRMGSEYLVTAEDDGCASHKEGAACQTILSVLLPRKGRFLPVVDVPVERIGYSGKAERGSLGVLEYRLTSVPEFKDDAIKVVEQVRVKDDTGRELRKAEHERVITVDDRGGATASEPSLWDQVIKSEDLKPQKPEKTEKPKEKEREREKEPERDKAQRER